MSERSFIKSSYSEEEYCVEASVPEGYVFKESRWSGGNGGNCVEIGVSAQSDVLFMRDSKFEGSSPLIETSPKAFTAFVGAIALEDFAQAQS